MAEKEMNHKTYILYLFTSLFPTICMYILYYIHTYVYILSALIYRVRIQHHVLIWQHVHIRQHVCAHGAARYYDSVPGAARTRG